LPDLNLELKFDIDGVEINNYLNPSPNPNPTPTPTFPPNPNPTPPTQSPQPGTGTQEPPDLSSINNRLDDIVDGLDELEECACPPDYVIEAESIGSGNSISGTLPVNTIAVQVVVTTRPENARRQSGASAPEVFYAGWYSFGYGSVTAGDRLPVHYLSSVYFAPEFATTFSCTLYNGFIATFTAIKRVPVE
jgi:hypothetical protein